MKFKRGQRVEWMAGGRLNLPGVNEGGLQKGAHLYRTGEVVWSFDEEGDISLQELRSRIFSMTGFKTWRTEVVENPRTGVLVLTRRISVKASQAQLTPELWAPARGWLRVCSAENSPRASTKGKSQ